MADSTLDILVKLGVVGKEQVEQANRILEETKRQTTQNTGVAKEATEAIKEQGEKTEGLEINQRALKMALRQINPELAQLGHALRFATEGMAFMGSIIAVALAYKAAKDALKEWNAEMDKAAEKAADPTFETGILAKKDALDKAADAADAYALKIEEILTTEQSVTQELTTQLALMEKIAAARGQAATAEEGLALARVKEREASGQINKDQAALEEEQIKRAAAKKAFAEKTEAEDKKVDTTQEALDKASALEPDLKAKQAADAKALAEEEARRAQTKADFGDEAYKKKKKESDDEIKAAEEKYNKAGGAKLEDLKAQLADPTLTNEWQKANLRQLIRQYTEESSEAKNELDQKQGNAKLLEKGRSQYLEDERTSEVVVALKAASEESTKKYNENTDGIKKLTDEINQLKAVIASTRTVEIQAQQARDQTIRLDYEAGVERETKKTIDTEKKIAAEPVSNATHARAVAELAAAQKQLAEMAAAITEAAKSHSDTLPVIVKAYNDLKSANQNFAQQLGLSGN